MAASKKAVLPLVSVILVAGVVLAIVGVKNQASSSKAGSTESVASSSTPTATTKAVSSICAPTDYKEACVNSLQKVAQNESATLKDLVQAAIGATIVELELALNKTDLLSGAAGNDSRERMAVEDCKDLQKYAIQELQASFSTVGDSEMHKLSDRADELKNWLSAVISYQQSCLDGLSNPEVHQSMKDGMLNATQLTSNALAIVSEISDIITAMGIKIPQNLFQSSTNSRRLLGHTEVDDQGYPTWLTATNRRLLQKQGNDGVTPNAVVAKDGSGQFKTISAALAAYPKGGKDRYVIYVKAGIYNENVMVDKTHVNVYMYGDGPRRTVVTGNKNFRDGVTTFNTATFAAVGDGFIAKHMAFSNTAGPEGHQAVAVRVQSDMSAFINCRFDGYQDTLYAQAHRQFYRNCVISGTVDFIFGDAATVIQNSLLIVRKPLDNQQCAVTAQGRTDKRETTGTVIHNCRIVPEQKLFPVRFQIPTYLGRPWKEYSRTIIMESLLADFIQPAGFMEWQGNFALDTLSYAEYANRGPGAKTDNRVKWKGYKVITDRKEALTFTAGPFLQGDLWLKNTGERYMLGLVH